MTGRGPIIPLGSLSAQLVYSGTKTGRRPLVCRDVLLSLGPLHPGRLGCPTKTCRGTVFREHASLG